MAYPRRRSPASGSRRGWQAGPDSYQLGARGGVAEADSALQTLYGMRRRCVLKRSARPEPAAKAEDENELALNLVVLYEDTLTRHWATELWSRVDALIGSGGICRKTWRIRDLTQPDIFADAVRAAARAHVLVISLHDAGMLPPRFCDWAEAWVSDRIASGGAMVALIGVHPRPDAASGQVYAYLETLARRAGLDYLPHERKLPDESSNCGDQGLNLQSAYPVEAGISTGPITRFSARH